MIQGVRYWSQDRIIGCAREDCETWQRTSNFERVPPSWFEVRETSPDQIDVFTFCSPQCLMVWAAARKPDEEFPLMGTSDD